MFGQSIAFLMVYQFLALLLLFFFRESYIDSPRLYSVTLTHQSPIIRSGSIVCRRRTGRPRGFCGDEGQSSTQLSRPIDMSRLDALTSFPLQWVGWSRSHRAGVMIMSFGLIVLYLPMSTMAVHAIIWT